MIMTEHLKPPGKVLNLIQDSGSQSVKSSSTIKPDTMITLAYAHISAHV